MYEPIDYASITEINLSHQELDVLPDLSIYPNLTILYCGTNQLTSLDNLPASLTFSRGIPNLLFSHNL